MLASGGEPLQLTNDSTDKLVDSFSPDGTEIYYEAAVADGELWSVPTLGGSSAHISSGTGLVPSPRGDSFYFFRLSKNAVVRKPKIGISESVVFIPPQALFPIKILPFPDGTHLLIPAANIGEGLVGPSVVPLYDVDIATHSGKKIGELQGSPTGIVWFDPGKTLIFSRTVNGIANIWEYSLAGAELRQMTFGAGPDFLPMPAREGIYFVNGRRSGTLSVYRTRNRQSTDLVMQDVTQPLVSPDARHLAYIAMGGRAQQELWASDLDGNNRVMLASAAALTTLAFSSDGSQLAFSSEEHGLEKIYFAKVDGRGLQEIPWSGASADFAIWSPDSKILYFSGYEKDLSKVTLWRAPIGSASVQVIGDRCGEVLDISNDGRYLFTSETRGDAIGIHQVSTSDGKCAPLIAGLSTLIVHSAPDGKSLLYITATRGETTIYRQPWRDGKLTGPSQPALKLPFAFRQGYAGNAYDFSKDLSTVVYVRPGGQADLYFLGQH
jgi:Tol biopolymer transport system component